MDASVIIPVLNEGARLRRCLDAVRAQDLDGDMEVIVVDGGSTDGGPDRARQLPVRLLAAPGTTAGAARNIGAAHARGRFLVFTDADCVPQRGWLRHLTGHLRERPDLAGAGGALRNARHGRPGVFEDWDNIACYHGIITSNVAYRADAFREVGGFDPALRCAEDWDLGWRLLDAGHRIGHCRSAIVVHEPAGNLNYAAFLRKQVWYARSDVPAFAKTLRAHGTGRGRAGAREFARTAGLHAAGAAMLASVLLAPAGVAMLAGWGLQKTVRTALTVPEARRGFFGLWAHNTAKGLARGWGTLRGVGDLLRGRWPTAPEPGPITELWTALARAPERVQDFVPELAMAELDAEPRPR
ncbi:MAG: glycosyltransferase [Halobacteriales archaeon]|nr:glycosyltransferase [Halobacteriales archaeon]